MVINFDKSLVTMKDVAEHAGVSMMTVSRVLNKEVKVRESTREKVMTSVSELGYKPNLSARSLAASKSFFVGSFYLDARSGYYAQFLVGALHKSRDVGYHLVVEPIPDAKEEWVYDSLSFYKESNLAGVILPPPLCESLPVVEALHSIEAPIVRVSPSKHDARAASIRIDEFQAAYDMTQYLLSHGHRKIGFILGADDQQASHQRYEGFCAALSEAGLSPNPKWIGKGEYRFKQALIAADYILKDENNRPTAIFASNDDMASAVYSSAHRHGLSVPQDLSVTGFDDTPIATTIWPALTTVKQPIDRMAAEAVETLVHMLSEHRSHGVMPIDDKVIGHTIMERGSVRQLEP
ncbi:LacI family DNA-binding transcriptional regulator [Temperatibacter marinus]|uniref:LacI family DNA-binding transcriptional regulator n=1 Tax=Temperatibacter marinus TaxID=1456591 RepID=A0AA52HA56_9PROT|nr:LacI family DNA-binding transcriptional regulator [Temperatibacter marinus]WND03891.1 LacI family DNA-binding transcriptional regulator [Temperatibacter marinus]